MFIILICTVGFRSEWKNFSKVGLHVWKVKMSPAVLSWVSQIPSYFFFDWLLPLWLKEFVVGSLYISRLTWHRTLAHTSQSIPFGCLQVFKVSITHYLNPVICLKHRLSWFYMVIRRLLLTRKDSCREVQWDLCADVMNPKARIINIWTNYKVGEIYTDSDTVLWGADCY